MNVVLSATLHSPSMLMARVCQRPGDGGPDASHTGGGDQDAMLNLIRQKKGKSRKERWEVEIKVIPADLAVRAGKYYGVTILQSECRNCLYSPLIQAKSLG